ncbi:MAG TPA: cysteine hydrolase family protein [Gemmatimonadales bacterium]|nr:cysteine hydrolase family protein [Gemmatimonadales bacterium]
MPRVIFWDVDTQYDFMRADGRLYVPGSEEIIPTVRALTDFAHAHGITIVASADDHVPGHRELSDTPDWRETFPPHCMRGTPGQQKIAETALRDPLLIEPEPEDGAAFLARVRAHRGHFLLHKHWFDVFTNANVLPLLDALAPELVVLYGVALDVCNRYAIEGLLAHRADATLWLVTDAARAIDADAAEGLLADWAARGVRHVTAREILEEGALAPWLGAGAAV